MGGIHTRASIYIPDGTKMEVQYDTRVTALVNGIILVKKPDATTITTYDTAIVEVRPGNINNHTMNLESYVNSHGGNGGVQPHDDNDGCDTPRSTQESPDVTSGVYVFNCEKGTMDVHDHEDNHFYASLAGDITVDLAGEIPGVPARAVVANPIQPRLFVLDGSGRGMELLRPDDIIEYYRLHSLTKNATMQPPIPM